MQEDKLEGSGEKEAREKSRGDPKGPGQCRGVPGPGGTSFRKNLAAIRPGVITTCCALGCFAVSCRDLGHDCGRCLHSSVQNSEQPVPEGTPNQDAQGALSLSRVPCWTEGPRVPKKQLAGGGDSQSSGRNQAGQALITSVRSKWCGAVEVASLRGLKLLESRA